MQGDLFTFLCMHSEKVSVRIDRNFRIGIKVYVRFGSQRFQHRGSKSRRRAQKCRTPVSHFTHRESRSILRNACPALDSFRIKRLAIAQAGCVEPKYHAIVVENVTLQNFGLFRRDLRRGQGASGKRPRCRPLLRDGKQDPSSGRGEGRFRRRSLARKTHRRGKRGARVR